MSLSHDLNGKLLRIGTYDNYPLSWTKKESNGTITGHGVAFAIVEILRQKFNFTFEVVVPENNYEFGGVRPESSLINLVNSSKIDMAAAFLTRLVKFNKKATFSNDLDEGVWMMMLKRPKESAAGSGLLAPFETYVWYLILVAVVCYGPCITFLTRIRSKLVRDKERPINLPESVWFVYGSYIKQGTNLSPEASKYLILVAVVCYGPCITFLTRIRSKLVRDKERPINLPESVWFVYGSYIKQGTNLSPEANTTRVLFATWWIFIILLSAFYTANLTAFLTLSKFTLDIESPKDLYKKSYRWIAAEGGAVQYTIKNPDEELYYLNKMVSNGRAQFRSVSKDEDYLPIVRAGAVLVKEQTAIDHLMYGDYLKKAREGVNEGDRCTYVVAPQFFMKKQRAFAYPNNTTLKVLFDTVIRDLLKAGIVNYLEHRDLPSTKICPLDLQSKDRQLSNSDLMMTYIIMAIGLATATAVFIGEVFIKRSKCMNANSNKDKDNKRKRKKSRVRFVEHSYDDSRPPPYDSLFGGKPQYKITDRTQRKVINGREYCVFDTANGGTRLIPVRTPSAFLYQ
ncbi:Glutamate receptor delta-2 subunit [Papilio machaon]|uniref:Glutamate receptor delta-2 subunit n=1 Tax=Papilio machaon TaxID=76193 RepID=A0A194RCE5_PAPMA|nr:Glutamate receptor delta-2 subunit [Papilio machaon]